MSFPDPELRQLSPPELRSKCMMCGLWKKFLPWQVSFIDGSWGAVCDNCARPFLIRLLCRRLPPTFSEVELLEIFCELGLGKKESEFLFQGLQKEGIIRTCGKGFTWYNGLIVEPICSIPTQPQRAHKRKYHRLSGEEVFLRCVGLTKEILEGENSR